MPRAELCNLADTSRHGILVAFGARLGVVDRPQAILGRLALLELLLVRVEDSLGGETVGLIVEACRRFTGRLAFYHGLDRHDERRDKAQS